MTFDRAQHCRKLSSDPALLQRRIEAQRERMCVVWDADMDAKLIELAHAGKGAIPIGNAIGVSKLLVRKRREQLGLPKGRPPGPKRTVPQKAGTVIVKLI